MPSTKCEGLSYPTHFLKFRVVLLGIIFLNTELNKLHFLRDERISLHCSLQTKQNIVPFLKVNRFSISQHFLNIKV